MSRGVCVFPHICTSYLTKAARTSALKIFPDLIALPWSSHSCRAHLYTFKQYLNVKVSLLCRNESQHLITSSKECGSLLLKASICFTLLDLPFHSLGVSLHIEEIQEVLVGAHFLVAPGPKTLDLLKTPANPKPPGLPIPPPIPLLPRKPSLMEMGLLLPRL